MQEEVTDDDDSLVAAERAAAGFAVECEKCHAPIKPEWPRCVIT